MLLPLMMMLSIPTAFYLKGFSWEEASILAPLFNLGAFLVLGCIPTFILHFQHRRSSKDMKISIDYKAEKLIIEKEGIHSYDFDSLSITEYLALSKKRNEDGKFRIITPWSNFSYLHIKTSDDKDFMISSNVMNPRAIPIEIKQKKYSLWPTIKN